jgi:hypothetical protein
MLGYLGKVAREVSMPENPDPLDELLVDAAALDHARIANALKGRVAVDRSTGLVVPQAGFDQLSATQKVLCFLLGKKVASLLGVASDETAAPSEVAERTGLPPGTARPTLAGLFDSHRLAKKGRTYFLSGAQVSNAIDAIAAKESSNGSDDTPPETPSSRPKSRRKRTIRTGKKRKGETVAKPSARSARGARRHTGGSSPTSLVTQLVEGGFFDSAKTMSDAQKRIKDKRGYQIPVTTLSPIFARLLRAGTLDREKNDDGVYEYTKHRG